MNSTDPFPEASWQVWYQDKFDRESPRQTEVSGTGLVAGLIELWSRYLMETVTQDGKEGFSHFNLWWRETRQSIKVEGNLQGAARLRKWLVGTSTAISRRDMVNRNRDLFTELATTHALLFAAGQSGAMILYAAAIAADEMEFWNSLKAIRLSIYD